MSPMEALLLGYAHMSHFWRMVNTTYVNAQVGGLVGSHTVAYSKRFEEFKARMTLRLKSDIQNLTSSSQTTT